MTTPRENRSQAASRPAVAGPRARNGCSERRAEELINDLAAAQHGVVSRSQLLAAGVRVHTVDRRVNTGRLVVVHRGVYRVGPLRSPLFREIAAVLACGGGAMVSDRSAGALWGMPRQATGTQGVDVIVQGADRGRVPGINARRVRALGADEVTQLEGIAVTTPARTLLDLARVLTMRDLERAVAWAERENLAGRSEISTLLQRRPYSRGSRKLRALLRGDEPRALTRSEAEERLLALVRKAGAPAPEVNVQVEGYEVDFLWRAEQLVVEVDGFAFHASPRAFEGDRERDAVLTAAGMRVVRVTWRQIVSTPEATLLRLAQALVR